MATLLSYRATVIRSTTATDLVFTITKGWREAPAIRGEPTILATRAGQYEATGWYEQDHLDLRLHGYVIGQGATEVLAQQSFDALGQSLRAIFDPNLLAGSLVVTAPFMGLASGTATIQARTVNALWTPPVAGYWGEVDVDLVCIANPPTWVRVP